MAGGTMGGGAEPAKAEPAKAEPGSVGIVGGGIIGLAAAHWLAADGLRVTLIDQVEPGSPASPAASMGNAGWIAHTDILPLSSPKIWRQIPRWLVDPLGPLAIRPAYLPHLLPWLLRFTLAGRPAAFARSQAGLIALQQAALPAWQTLAQRLGLAEEFRPRGTLSLFDDAAGLARAVAGPVALQQRLGIAVEVLDAPAVRALEPSLSNRVVGALHYPTGQHVSDPARIVRRLAEAMGPAGISFVAGQAVEIAPSPDGARVTLAGGEALSFAHVILAGGAWSRPLAASLGDRVPLDTERGYNRSFPGLPLLTRPVAFEGHGFVASPLDSGLRIGGAVEFGGLTAAPNHRRGAAMLARARQFLPDLPAEGGSQWMGFRPSLPDSLPVIGPSRASPHILHAFGHGHYGLTQAAITGRLLADLILRRPPILDPTPYRVDRF